MDKLTAEKFYRKWFFEKFSEQPIDLAVKEAVTLMDGFYEAKIGELIETDMLPPVPIKSEHPLSHLSFCDLTSLQGYLRTEANIGGVAGTDEQFKAIKERHDKIEETLALIESELKSRAKLITGIENL